LREVIAGEQQRRLPAFGQRIREAIAVIECGWMPSLAIAALCQTRKLGLVLIDRDDLDLSAVDKEVKLVPARFALAALDYHRGFEQVPRG
jgi:tRNA A37 threonylcarbamoyladenosine dehydratase